MEDCVKSGNLFQVVLSCGQFVNLPATYKTNRLDCSGTWASVVINLKFRGLITDVSVNYQNIERIGPANSVNYFSVASLE